MKQRNGRASKKNVKHLRGAIAGRVQYVCEKATYEMCLPAARAPLPKISSARARQHSLRCAESAAASVFVAYAAA